MSWFKVDDKIHSHQKVKRIPRRMRLAAIGLWTLTGAWAADHDTDGNVPAHMIDDFDGTDEVIDALVEAGMWDRTDAGIVFHDWATFQPTKESKERDRSQTAERVRKYRQRTRNDSEKPTTSEKGNGVTPPAVTGVYAPPVPSRPVPSRKTPPTPSLPDLMQTPEESPRKRGSAFVYPEAFEEWWATYPKKDDKRGTLPAWKRITREVDNTVLVEAAQRYRDDPNRSEQYTKLPKTWLNAGAWENGPLPPRGSGSRPQAGDTHRAMERSHNAAQTYRQLEDAGYYDQPAQITPLDHRRTA